MVNNKQDGQNLRSVKFVRANQFRQFIEREVLKIVKMLSKKGKTSKEKIQAIAKTTIQLIKPGMGLEELYQNAVKLDDEHQELAPVVYQVMKEYEQKYERKAIDYVSYLIKDKKYDQAQEMVKKVLAFKVFN